MLQGVEDLDMENEKWSDVNVVSSLLKTFFRKLPDPLITEGQYQLSDHWSLLYNHSVV